MIEAGPLFADIENIAGLETLEVDTLLGAAASVVLLLPE